MLLREGNILYTSNALDEHARRKVSVNEKADELRKERPDIEQLQLRIQRWVAMGLILEEESLDGDLTRGDTLEETVEVFLFCKTCLSFIWSVIDSPCI